MNLSVVEALDSEVHPDDVADGVGLSLIDELAIVTLARPQQLNALTLAGWRRLVSIFTELAAVDALRCVVVRGAGRRAFGAGADIREFPDVRLTPAAAIGYNEAIAAALEQISGLQKPVVAMIDGVAIGGGCELAAACDVRLASADARFGIPIGRLGVTLGYTEAVTVARLIGAAELKYLLFSGEIIDAYEAQRIGLVQRVLARNGDLASVTADLIGQILSSSDVTIRAAKVISGMAGRALTPHDTELLTRFTVEAYGGADLKEGVAAFTERRTPTFGRDRRSTDGCT